MARLAAPLGRTKAQLGAPGKIQQADASDPLPLAPNAIKVKAKKKPAAKPPLHKSVASMMLAGH